MFILSGCFTPERDFAELKQDVRDNQKSLVELERDINVLKSSLKTQDEISRMKIAELEKQLDAREKELKQSIPVAMLFESEGRYSTPSKAVELYLNQIRPEKGATEQEIRTFLGKLRPLFNSNLNDGSRSLLDQELSAFSEPKYLEFLLEANSDNLVYAVAKIIAKMDRKELYSLIHHQKQNRNRNRGYYVLMNAFLNIADASDKEFILQNLDYGQGNIFALLKRLNLEKEAAPLLKKMIMDGDGNNNFSSNQEVLSLIVNNLSDEKERKEFMDAIWCQVQSENSMNRGNIWSSIYAARAFINSGYLPAFRFLAENLQTAMNHDSRIPKMIIARSDMGEEKDFSKWYAANKDKIVFDEKAKRYMVETP